MRKPTSFYFFKRKPIVLKDRYESWRGVADLLRFTTYERLDNSRISIVKKDRRRESFDREKLLSGLYTACEKRPLPTELLKSWRMISNLNCIVWAVERYQAPR